VISMQENYAVPSGGVVDYQHFEVPTNLTNDRWIQAAEIRPGNRASSITSSSTCASPARRRSRLRAFC
jgi:hypothetical protein